jgi:hypothetical protein
MFVIYSKGGYIQLFIFLSYPKVADTSSLSPTI